MPSATRFLILGIILAVFGNSGCGGKPPAPQKTTGTPAVSPPPAPPPPPAPVQPPVVSAPALGSTPVAPVVTPPPKLPVEPAVTSEPPPGSERVKIGESGKKDFGGPAIVKPITVPAQTYFSVKWQVIGFQVQSALTNYKALNGAPPKTEKEFFERVLKENEISLPKLPEGHRYLFDVETQELMVERPQ